MNGNDAILANNLERQFRLYQQEFEDAALRTLRSGWYVLGTEVREFEREWADYVGAQQCVGLASGLDALWISFRLLGIGVGDEVIVAANAYIACVMGITMNGATPVFVEPDIYHNIDVSRIGCAITEKTKAILPVHLYGQPCNMTEIMRIAHKYNLKVVEDCAQSHGTKWNGQCVGTFGDVGCFSFYPTKGCGAFGDAGAIVTNDTELADRFRTFRNYGSKTRYQNEVVGANSRLDELQAALLRVRLSHLNTLNAERQRLAENYLSNIRNPNVLLPQTQESAYCTWHQFVIHCSTRNELMNYLADRGIGTLIHYPIPPHLSKAYEYLQYEAGDFPVAERMANEVLSLPMYNGMTEDEQTYVIKMINSFRV